MPVTPSAIKIAEILIQEKVIKLTGDKKSITSITYDTLIPLAYNIDVRWTQLKQTYGIRRHFEDFSRIGFVIDILMKEIDWEVGRINYEFG